MRLQKPQNRFLLITFCIAIVSLTFSFQVSHSQNKPLSLAQVLTGLQSKSGGFTMSQKNSFITGEVRKKGVTFRLTPELEKELRLAGASTTLIRAIRLKSPRKDPTPEPINNNTAKPDASFQKLRVEHNVVQDGLQGIKIFADFKVFNLKEVKSDIVFRFQRDGQFLKGTLDGYKTVGGHVSGRRFLAPAFDRTVYEELDAFIPYKAFGLNPGVHNIQIDADVIKRDGTQVKHLVLQDLRLVIPSPIKGSATLGRFWVDYNVKENGQSGMRVHVKMTVKGMKGQTAYLRVLFTKNDGTPLKGFTPKYRTKGGDTALFRKLRPRNITSYYNDIALFIPYSELNVPKGRHSLKMHADVIADVTYQKISHLTIKSFSFRK